MHMRLWGCNSSAAIKHAAIPPPQATCPITRFAVPVPASSCSFHSRLHLHFIQSVRSLVTICNPPAPPINHCLLTPATYCLVILLPVMPLLHVTLSLPADDMSHVVKSFLFLPLRLCLILPFQPLSLLNRVLRPLWPLRRWLTRCLELSQLPQHVAKGALISLRI